MTNKLQPPADLFRVGDTVYTADFGEGVVEAVKGDEYNYPVRVKFTCRPEAAMEFTKDGRLIRDLGKRGLFFAPVELNAVHYKRPRAVFKPGNVVFNKYGGAVAIVSHDSPSTDHVALFQAGGSSGPTYRVSHTDLVLIAESVTPTKE